MPRPRRIRPEGLARSWKPLSNSTSKVESGSIFRMVPRILTYSSASLANGLFLDCHYMKPRGSTELPRRSANVQSRGTGRLIHHRRDLVEDALRLVNPALIFGKITRSQGVIGVQEGSISLGDQLLEGRHIG